MNHLAGEPEILDQGIQINCACGKAIKSRLTYDSRPYYSNFVICANNRQKDRKTERQKDRKTSVAFGCFFLILHQLSCFVLPSAISTVILSQLHRT